MNSDSPLFHFTTDLSTVPLPPSLNNPFGNNIPMIAKIAAKEFQVFLLKKCSEWKYDFNSRPGKMFGVLVVELEDKELAFLGTISGYLDRSDVCLEFVPSVYRDEEHDFFLFKNMTAITDLGNRILESKNHEEIEELNKKRSKQSVAIQKKLFTKYLFRNTIGETKSVKQIFNDSDFDRPPPAAAGECAAPKLLQYAIENNLKPVAIAEFWWGNETKDKERQHLHYYPACKDKCKPILEYMLMDDELFVKGRQELAQGN